MISRKNFPGLTDNNHRITSPSTPVYNCIAWSVEDNQRWWQPGVFWPIGVTQDDAGLGDLVAAFLALGFEECEESQMERGFEKVALYGNTDLYTHAARQLANGKWTSKLGRSEDIEHEAPDDISGGVYGEVMQYMRRAISTVDR